MGEEFNNKEIIKMMMDFKSDIKGLQAEIQETKNLLRNYNGLREKMMAFEIELATFKKEISTLNECKKEQKSDWRWVAGWIVAVGSLIISVISNFFK